MNRSIPEAASGTAKAAVLGLWHVARIERGELAMALGSFGGFFCVLCGYYVLRPLRDAMGVEGGVQNLPWLFSVTFAAMLAAVPLFGFAAARLPRRRLVPWAYLFFLSHLALFYFLFKSGAGGAATARAFFVWVSVFNLFVVSLFWSLMADLWRPAQAARLFGFISAGGSCGALAGPSITALLASALGVARLILVSIAFFLLALALIALLLRNARGDDPVCAGQPADWIGGTAWSGIAAIARSGYLLGVVAYVLFYTVIFGLAYFELARLTAVQYPDAASRTTLFARVDLAVNLLTLFGQLFVAAKWVERLGVGAALALLPAIGVAGFAAIGAWPVLPVLIGFQILRRACDYAIARPAREMLFTVVAREQKYKSKNFIDTVVFRGGDAASGALYALLSGLGLGLAGIAAVAIPCSVVWLVFGLALGKQHARLAARA